MKRILALILTICMIITLAPVTIFAADDPGYGMDLGTPIVDYTLNKAFAESDIGQLVIKDVFDTDVDGYTTTYDENGITVTRTAEAGTASTAYRKLGFNLLAPKTGYTLSTDNYMQGLEGIYAIDQTFQVNYGSAATKRTDIYYLDTVLNESAISEDTGTFPSSKDYIDIRTTGSMKWRGSLAYTSFTKAVDCTIRTVFDTVNGKSYHYNVGSDGTYTFIDEGELDIKSLVSMVYGPRLYVARDWSITFKNITVYEIDNALLTEALDSITAESITGGSVVSADLTLPTATESGYSVAWDSLNENIISDAGKINTSAGTTEDTEVTFKVTVSDGRGSESKEIKFTVAKTGEDTSSTPGSTKGTLLAEYTLNKTFAESDLGKLVVKDIFNDDNAETENDGFATTYGDNGITVTRTGETGTAGTQYPNIAFNLLVPVTGDTVSADNYRQGLEGTYALEQTFNVSWPTGTARKRTDLYFTDIAAADTDEKFSTSGDSNLRIFTTGGVSYYSGDNGTNYGGAKNGTDYTIRTVIDTVNGKTYHYDINADGTYTYIGENATSLDSIMSIVYGPRAYAAKDWSITFKSIKIYEIEKAVDLQAELDKITAESISGNATGVLTGDLTLPLTTEGGYTISWDSLNDNIISDAGVINKDSGITEDTEVTFKVTVTYGDKSESKEIKFTVAKTGGDTPVVPPAGDPNTGGTLLANYTLNEDFAASDLGKLVVKDLFNVDNAETENDGFATTYGDNGITVTRTGETGTAGTQYIKLAFNLLVPETGDTVSADNYRQGLEGIYAIEQTFNVSYPSGATRKRTDLYFTDAAAADTDEKFSTSSDSNLRIFTTGGVSYYSGDNSTNYGGAKNGTDYTIRTVIDTVNGKTYHYDISTDGTYTLKGENACSLDSLMSITYGPRAYTAKDWSITFKNIRVYEIERYIDLTGALDEVTAESITGNSEGKFTDNLSLPSKSSKGYAISWDSLNDSIISDAGVLADNLSREDDIEVTFKVTVSYEDKSEFKEIKFTLVKEGGNVPSGPDGSRGKMIINYDLNKDFAESYIGEKVIVDRYDILKASGTDYGFETTYTDDGITIEHTEDALFVVEEDGKVTKDPLATVDGFALNLAYLMEDDTLNNTKTYQTGVTGVYDIELTMIPDYNYELSQGKDVNPRMDFYFDDNVLYEDNETWDKVNNLRSYSSGRTYYSGNSSVSFTSFSSGKEYKIRVVIDTDNKTVTGYSVDKDGNYVENGTSNYTGEIVSAIWIRFRTYFEKGDKLTLKNLTIYEGKRSTSSGAAVAISTFADTMPDSLVADPAAVTEKIVIPANISDVASSVETSNDKLVTTKGVIKRGFTDRTATLDFSGSADGAAYNKIYTLVIKARDDLNIVPLSTYDFTTQDAVDNIMYVGDSVLTDKGFKVVNTKGLTSQAIGMLEYEKSPDTYIYDHSGAYDVELSVIPNITTGRAYLEIGNYNVVSGTFVPYNRLYIDTDGIVYADKYDDIALVTEATTGNEYDIKLRVDMDNMEFWTWVDGVSASDDGFEYDSTSDILNAYRIGFENAGINDSVTLTEGKLTQQVYASTVSLDDTLAVADSIKSTDIVSNPDDAYGDITLPTFNGYNIEWSTNNPLADLEAKKLYHTSAIEDITLTAIISAESNPEIRVKKDFHIKVSATTDPVELLEGALAKLVPESITNQNPKALIADLLLPSSTEDGYSIEWKSLSPEYIDDDGRINSTINIAEPTEVTLEATITSNGTSRTKNVKFTIAKRGADVTLTPADITVSAEGVVTYKATVSNTNGTVYLKDDNGNNIIGLTVDNSKLSFDYKNADNKQIDVTGAFDIEVVMNSADRCATVIVDDKVVLDYVPYIDVAGGFKNAVSSGVSLTDEKVVFGEYSLFDYNMKVYGYLDVLENIYVTGNLNLKTDAIGGVKVEWTSSDEVLMTNDGKFDAPEAISFFDMVFKMSMINGTDAAYGEKISCVAVPATDLMQNAVFSSDVLDDANNDRSKLYDNNYSTYLLGKNVTADNYITIDLGSSMDVTSLYFFQSQDEGGMNSCDIYLSNDGVTWSPVASAAFSDLKSNYVYFGLNKARYVKITNISADNNNFKLYELKAFVAYSSDNKAYFDIMALNMPAEYELTQASITLPTTGAKYGSVMTWSSSDPSVIATNGTITRPVYSKEIILTVTAELGGKTVTNSYMYLIKGTATSGSPAGGSGGAGGGGGGSYAGNIAGVNTGGTDISAQPQENGIELDKVEYENAPKGIFNDVYTTDWYYDYLVDLKEKGIVSGYEDGNFYPNNQVTREEFLKMLISATGTEFTGEVYEFADVDADDWFAPYVYTAKANGIAKGMDENTFGVGMSISRQDMSVMVYNILGANIELADDTEMFADHSDIAIYAFNAVYAMKTIGVLSGYESGEFMPNGYLTRAEATKVISLIIKML